MNDPLRGTASALRAVAVVAVFATFLAACSGAPETGPVEVRWDRDVCAQCTMAISDRNYAAQVRGAPAGEPTRVDAFDDLGCAVLWLDAQAWKSDPRTEVWVTDHRTGEWIDARIAGYVDERVSPMDFGLGAVKDPAQGSFGWDEAAERIRDKQSARTGIPR
ncbi:MAG: hypothetical protein DHS20C21_05420 [Gemmatimonadota bacterium]|nr:MAG: hypothetical protein DHS20C21_05420 [Gemmatimonadota bacterium]